MLKPIKFEVKTKEVGANFDLRVQNKRTEQEYVLTSNPETLMLEGGDVHVYLLRVTGKEKTKFTLTIENATQARTPVTITIPEGKNSNVVNDIFTA